MRWLLVNHKPVGGTGGSGNYTAAIADELEASGDQVCTLAPGTSVLASSRGHQHVPVAFAVEGLAADAVPSFTGSPRSALTYDKLTSAQMNQYATQWRNAITETVARFHPDVIQAQHLFVAAEACTHTRIPLIVTSHGSELDYARRQASQRPADLEYVRAAARGACAVVCVSRYVARVASDLLGNLLRDAIVVHNGHDPSLFATGDRRARSSVDARHLVCGGRLVPYKRIDVAIEAVGVARDVFGKSVRLTVVGDGPDRRRLEALARSVEVEATFTGFLGQHVLAGILRDADVFLSPAEHEPFGLVVLEALASGTPVVASSSGGTCEFVTADGGRLVDGWDPKTWAATLVGQLDRQTSPQRVGASVRRLTWHAHAEKLRELAEEVADTR